MIDTFSIFSISIPRYVTDLPFAFILVCVFYVLRGDPIGPNGSLDTGRPRIFGFVWRFWNILLPPVDRGGGAR